MVKYNWEKSVVEDAVNKSSSYSDALRKLGVKLSGNNGKTLKRKIKEYKIDISHFTFYSESSNKKDIQDYLVKNSHINNFKLKEKLIKCGIKENKCEICGNDSWMGKPLKCQLHHINGDNTDNRIENLQMLCPNCHSQTENYCGLANKIEKEPHYCPDCGRELKTKNSKYCPSCAAKKRKAIKISKDELIKILKKHSGNRLQTSRELEVSETCIRKWCKKFGLPDKSKDLKDFLK